MPRNGHKTSIYESVSFRIRVHISTMYVHTYVSNLGPRVKLFILDNRRSNHHSSMHGVHIKD